MNIKKLYLWGIAIAIIIILVAWISDLWQILLGILLEIAVGLILNYWPELQQKFIETNKLGRLHSSADKITSEKIMGTRGKPERGFSEIRFRRRNVDEELESGLVGKYAKKIVILSGAPVSGKSRSVYQFIRSENGAQFHDHIYVVEHDNVEFLAKKIKTDNLNASLFVIDNPDRYSETERTALWTLLETIDRSARSKAVITVSTERDDFEGQKLFEYLKGKEMQNVAHITIAPIKNGSEEHNWCTGNMSSTDFSPVIGAYVPEEKEYTNKKIAELLADADATAVMTAWESILRFRKDKGQELQYILRMYTAQNSDSTTLKNFNDGVKKLAETGILSLSHNPVRISVTLRTIEGKQIDENITLEGLNKIHDRIEWNNIKFVISDRQLYEAFKRKARSMSTLDGGVVGTFLAYGHESEMKLIKALINIDPEDPVYYKRAVTKARHVEQAIALVESLMMTHFFENSTIKPRLTDEQKDGLSGLIGNMTSRKGFKTFGEYKGFFERYIRMGVTPNMESVGELFRIAVNYSDLRDEICDYAEGLMKKYRIDPSIYYYQRAEELDDGYDIDRTKEAIELEEYGENKTYYCGAVLKKATDGKKITELFDSFLPETDSTGRIVFDKNQVLGLMSRLNDADKSGLLDCLERYRSRFSGSDEDRRSLYIGAIEKSRSFDAACGFREKCLLLAQTDTEPYENNRNNRVSALSLFKKIKNETDFEACKAIYTTLRQDEETIFSSLKLFNRLLGSSPSCNTAEKLFLGSDMYKEKHFDMYTLNHLMGIAIKENDKRKDRLCEAVSKIDGYRKDADITPDPIYLNLLYSCNADKDLAEIIKDVSELIGENRVAENPILQSQKITRLKSENDLPKLLKIATSIRNGMKDEEKYFDSDVCKSLLEKATDNNFRNNVRNNPQSVKKFAELNDIVDEIVELDRIGNPKIHYYHSLLERKLKKGLYGPGSKNVDMEKMKSDLEKAFITLKENHARLSERGDETPKDLIATAVGHSILDRKNAQDIIDFARTLSKSSAEFSDVYNPELIASVLEKKHKNDPQMPVYSL